jgi:hypothetical protein
MLKIDFSFDTSYGLFADALYLFEDHDLSSEQIEALKKDRLDKWLEILTNPKPPSPYVTLDGVQYEKIEVDGKLILNPVVEEAIDEFSEEE